jgi:hypothetical protein
VYVCGKFTNIKKKIELFGPALLRHFLLKKLDFLGIFKTFLREFHCIKVVLMKQDVKFWTGFIRT